MKGEAEGTKRTNLVLVPIVCSVFGKLGSEGAEWLEAVEALACSRGRPYDPPAGQPRRLAELASLMAILLSAELVYAAYTKPRSQAEMAGQATPEICEQCERLIATGPATCRVCMGRKGHHRLDHEGCLKSRCPAGCPGQLARPV